MGTWLLHPGGSDCLNNQILKIGALGAATGIWWRSGEPTTAQKTGNSPASRAVHVNSGLWASVWGLHCTVSGVCRLAHHHARHIKDIDSKNDGTHVTSITDFILWWDEYINCFVCLPVMFKVFVWSFEFKMIVLFSRYALLYRQAGDRAEGRQYICCRDVD